MGGSTSKQQYHDLGELMRKKDEPAVLAELAKTKYDPDKGSRRTESCFEVAAKVFFPPSHLFALPFFATSFPSVLTTYLL
jgi:hypothetical protein